MITREDLENAAFAVGMPLRVVGAKVATYALHPDRDGVDSICCMSQWNPHTDDGDTARLAVRMGMLTEVTGLVAEAYGPERYTNQRIAHDGTEPDKMRAWREAVTLCAAAVGERMREGGA